jgi:DNA-binding CsgD family transcriptional regulator
MTASAATLLADDTSPATDAAPRRISPALLDLALGHIRSGAARAAAKFAFRQLSVRISACEFGAEYLLLLQKTAGDWNLANLRQELGLTTREAEVLMWISRGKTNRDIGLILDNSPRTVNKHLEHIFEKLGVATRSAAVSVALRHAGVDG